MRAALGLARRGLGRVWPNPAVGCVLVRDGVVVGRGWTADGGRPHAETVALAQAGARRARAPPPTSRSSPATTPAARRPAPQALIAAGVARVVVADRGPRPAGRRRAASRRCARPASRWRSAASPTEAAALNRGFLSRLTAGRPTLTLKLATSIDGRIATGAGESRWITGPRAPRRGAPDARAGRRGADRRRHGARRTTRSLDVRGIGLAEASPVRVVVSGSLALPRDGHLGAHRARARRSGSATTPRPDPARRKAWEERGAVLIEVPVQPDGQLDLGGDAAAAGRSRPDARALRGRRPARGGAAARATSSTRSSPTPPGWCSARRRCPSVGMLEVEALQLAPRFRLVEAVRVGPDVRSRWRRP